MSALIRPCLILLLLVIGLIAGRDQARAQDIQGLVRLRIGVLATPQFRPAAQKYEPFRAWLAEQLSMPVEIEAFKDGQALVDAAATRRLDYAIFSASTYAMTWRACGCFEPLAVPKALDGTAGVKSILLVRNDSAFRKPGDLAGKVLAASDARSVASRLIPLSELAAEGFDQQSLARIETFKGPDLAVQALLDRKVDAALAWSTLEGDSDEGFDRGTLHDLVERRVLDMHAIRIIWKSTLVPNGPHAIRSDVPLDLKNRLRDLLVDLIDNAPDVYDAVEPNFGGGFVPIGHSVYLPFLRLVTPKGQDPAQPPVKSIAVKP